MLRNQMWPGPVKVARNRPPKRTLRKPRTIWMKDSKDLRVYLFPSIRHSPCELVRAASRGAALERTSPDGGGLVARQRRKILRRMKSGPTAISSEPFGQMIMFSGKRPPAP